MICGFKGKHNWVCIICFIMDSECYRINPFILLRNWFAVIDE